MPLTSKERQRRFKEKMYKAGFKQTILWIKQKEGKQPVNMTQAEFLKVLKKLTAGWEEDRLKQTYCLFIKIIKAKKEAEKLKKRK